MWFDMVNYISFNQKDIHQEMSASIIGGQCCNIRASTVRCLYIYTYTHNVCMYIYYKHSTDLVLVKQ